MYFTREDLDPIALAGAMALVGDGNSILSVLHFVSLIVEIVRKRDPYAMMAFSYDKTSSENREEMLRQWIIACSPLSLIGPNQIIIARASKGNSTKWGPTLWQALHNLSAMFTPSCRRSLLEVFQMLPFVLPCRSCRLHVQDSLIHTFPALEVSNNRFNFVNAVVRLHNFITLRIGSHRKLLLYEEPFISLNLEKVTMRTALNAIKNHGRSSKQPQKSYRDCGCVA
jgi:Erv1 / Alr family